MGYKNFVLLIGLGILLIGGYGLFNLSTKDKPSKTTLPESQAPSVNTNLSAGFAIFTNGTFRIFTAPMYHNLSKEVFIEADNPNIVHVRKSGLTWDDFFKTLPIKLTKDCLTTGTKQMFCTSENGTLQFYLNGRKDQNALDKQIKKGDRLLVTYGKESQEKIQDQLKKIPTAAQK